MKLGTLQWRGFYTDTNVLFRARVQEQSEEDQSDTAVLLWAFMGNGTYEQPLPGNTQ